ncbi:MAG: hypothetical protein ACFCU3_05155 [Verrucomicrobiales bacterium]
MNKAALFFVLLVSLLILLLMAALPFFRPAQSTSPLDTRPDKRVPLANFGHATLPRAFVPILELSSMSPDHPGLDILKHEVSPDSVTFRFVLDPKLAKRGHQAFIAIRILRTSRAPEHEAGNHPNSLVLRRHNIILEASSDPNLYQPGELKVMAEAILDSIIIDEQLLKDAAP